MRASSSAQVLQCINFPQRRVPGLPQASAMYGAYRARSIQRAAISTPTARASRPSAAGARALRLLSTACRANPLPPSSRATGRWRRRPSAQWCRRSCPARVTATTPSSARRALSARAYRTHRRRRSARAAALRASFAVRRRRSCRPSAHQATGALTAQASRHPVRLARSRPRRASHHSRSVWSALWGTRAPQDRPMPCAVRQARSRLHKDLDRASSAASASTRTMRA